MTARPEQHETCGWTLNQWQQAYRSGRQPPQLLHDLRERIQPGDPAWISIATAAQLDEQLAALAARLASVQGDLTRLPLYGIPYAAKDNLDAAGWTTTAGCPEFAYGPGRDATVVARLREAGAVLLGKTNLDQFATGLVGTRSPYGEVPNSFNADYISGGSSSGSASAVARGLVPFALGSDTAGSGRVPAGFNNIVGLKPTRGWLSTSGLVPACRTLDCVSVFALTVSDAALIAELAGGVDPTDPYSRAQPGCATQLPPRPRLAVPDALEFFGDRLAEQSYGAALTQLQALGAELVPVGYTPFRELASLLYEGPWVAERAIAIGELLQSNPAAIDPVVMSVVKQGLLGSAADSFRAEYRRAELAAQINRTLSRVDAMVVPTAPTIRRSSEIAKEPVLYNSQLGLYTNFANLADLCALAVPGGLRSDGLPAGITLIGRAWHDAALTELGRRYQNHVRLPLGATGRPALPQPPPAIAADPVTLAVVGAHLSGMPLNWQLTSRGAVLREHTTTAHNYRLYALQNSKPPKPALVRSDGGGAIVVELWDVPLGQFGALVAEVPPPLGIGNVTLADGRSVKGFICEPAGFDGAVEITAWGGWRAYLQRQP
ncbi:MAG TPA: allophanate hydrolase [Steroidobacteraceae bacterium]|nr:allophanate hydrolase [Steroidobacteraceae bacterium]